MPAQAKLTLDLPKSGVSPFADVIEAAERLVPKKLAEAEAKKLFSLARDPKTPNRWRLQPKGGERFADVFPEAPEPLFLDAKAVENGAFALTLETAAGGQPQTPAAATLTIVTEKGAYEAPARLE